MDGEMDEPNYMMGWYELKEMIAQPIVIVMIGMIVMAVMLVWVCMMPPRRRWGRVTMGHDEPQPQMPRNQNELRRDIHAWFTGELQAPEFGAGPMTSSAPTTGTRPTTSTCPSGTTCTTSPTPEAPM